MAKKLLPILIITSLLTPLATFAQTDTPNDSKAALAKVQTQIQHVADSIPQQIQASQATTNAAIAKQQQAIQEQLAHLQSEIEQLQKQNQTSITGLQKEIQALQNKG